REIHMAKRNYTFITVTLFILLYLFVPVAHAADKQVYEVGADNLNVRVAPGSNSEVIGHLQTGDRVTAFGEKHGWIQTYYNGKIAWVASQFLFKTDQSEQVNQSKPEAA